MTPGQIRAIANAVADELERSRAALPSVEVPPACSTGGYVYFIQCDAIGGFIKIGSARDIQRRLRTLQVGTPFAVVLVGYFWHPDAGKEEHVLHKIHALHRVRGEWFRPSEFVLDTIDRSSRRARRERSVLP